MHNSAVSQLGSLEARQTCVAGANWHCAVQHGELSGSQAALFRNLQVFESQHVEFEPLPGSQSSPVSTIPLPHICSVMVWREGSGFWRQLVFTLLACEPFISEPKWDVGDDNAREEKKTILRTDVPNRTLREDHLSGHRNWTHQEVRVGIAGTGRQWTASTCTVTTIGALGFQHVSTRNLKQK